MPFDAPPGESLCRYISSQSRIRRSNNTVRHTAFEPPPTGRLSVYWTTGLNNLAIWQICQQHVEPELGRPAIARADLNSVAVYAEGLTVDVNGVPHARHANIVGWDLADGTKTRLQAMKLASVGTLMWA